MNRSFRRRRRRPIPQRHRRSRSLLEALEPRNLLATITVTSLADNFDFDGMVTLREAIEAANQNISIDGSTAGDPGDDTIEFSPGLFGVPQTLQMSAAISSPFFIGEGLTINGPGKDLLTIDADSNNAVFHVGIGGDTFAAEFSGLTITGGQAPESSSDGAGIFSQTSGDLNVFSSRVQNNQTASSGSGGGIYATGMLDVHQSEILGNTANGQGGGIFGTGQIVIRESTLAGNRALGPSGEGGGVFSSDSVSLLSSTVDGNTSEQSGAGIFGLSNVNVVDSTIAANAGTGGAAQGGGIFNTAGSTFIQSSIVAENTAEGNPHDAELQTLTAFNSLFGVNDGTGLAGAPVGSPDANGNLVGIPGQSIDPVLNPLADNGGPTQTRALDPASPAVNLGNSGQLFDQRGSGFDRVVGLSADMGAFELQTQQLIVDITLDENDGDFSVGDLSLREAIFLADLDSAQDTIEFDPNVFSAAQTINLDPVLGELLVTEPVTILGPGSGLLTIDAGQNSRVFNLERPFPILDSSLSGMTITGGRTTGNNNPLGNLSEMTEHSGAGIRFLSGGGTLTLNDITVNGNQTEGLSAPGGGIFTYQGNLQITDSLISGNQTLGSMSPGGAIANPQGDTTLTDSSLTLNATNGTQSDGGAIITFDGELNLSFVHMFNNAARDTTSNGGGIYSEDVVNINSSTLWSNSAGGAGGGLFHEAFATSTIVNTTITGNSANVGGGLNIVAATLPVDPSNISISHSTITDNSSTLGGGIRLTTQEPTSTNVSISSTIIAGNNASSSPDFENNAQAHSPTLNFSLIGDGAGSGFSEAPVGAPDANGNLIGGIVNGVIDPLLNSLGSNGGTGTHSLMPGSPAIDSGGTTTLQFDQRGSGFPRVQGASVDIGAFESNFVALPEVTLSVNPTSVVEGASATLTFSRTGDVSNPLDVAIITGGTAISGTDYQALPSIVTFPAGSATTDLSAVTLPDAVVEGNESLLISLISGTDYDLGSPSDATLTIQDNTVSSGDFSLDSGNAFHTGSFVGSIGTGHLNSSSYPDIAVVNQYTRSSIQSADVVILWDPGMNLSNQSTIGLPTGTMGGDVYVGDLNMDGLGDIAVTNFTAQGVAGEVLVLLNDAANFASSSWSSYSTGSGTSAIAAADVNNDGYMDLAATNFFDNTVNILLGDGTGQFDSIASLSVGTNPTDVVFADVDQDGDQDMTVSNHGDGNVSLYWGAGDGSFSMAGALEGLAGPVSMAVGDFDINGFDDLAVTAGSTIHVVHNPGQLAGPTTFESVTIDLQSNLRGIIAEDFDGDGDADLMVANGQAGALTLVRSERGGFVRDFTQAVPALSNPDQNNSISPTPKELVAADFDNTGSLDIATSHFLLGGSLHLGNLTPASSQDLPPAEGELTNLENPMDVNADGQVSPLDALVILNDLLNPAEGESPRSSSMYPDVNEDGIASPLDALLVLNWLNGKRTTEGEATAGVLEAIEDQFADDELLEQLANDQVLFGG